MCTCNDTPNDDNDPSAYRRMRLAIAPWAAAEIDKLEAAERIETEAEKALENAKGDLERARAHAQALPEAPDTDMSSLLRQAASLESERAQLQVVLAWGRARRAESEASVALYDRNQRWVVFCGRVRAGK
jgi:hypothetical protein